MSTTDAKTLSRFLRPFLIGTMAGCAPFLLNYLMPVLLNGNQGNADPHWPELGGLAVLIGVIACIFFCDKPKLSAQDVFLQALGIPALLLGTLSSIQKAGETVQAKHTASEQYTNPAPILDYEGDVLPTFGAAQAREGAAGSALAWLIHPVLGQEPTRNARIQAADTVYLVVIGPSYSSLQTAREGLHRLQTKTLHAEQYAPKHPQIAQLTPGSYVVEYSRHARREDAVRVYRLLQINDSDVGARIVRWRKRR